MDKSEAKNKIENRINSKYGSDADFNLLSLDRRNHLLITPFIDNDNNFIELGLKVLPNNKIRVSDFGRGSRYMQKTERTSLDLRDSGVKAYRCIKERTPGTIEVDTDWEKVGENVAEVIRLLQKIYKYPIEKGKKHKFKQYLNSTVKNYRMFEAGDEIFNKKISYVLDAVGLKYERNQKIAGISGDLKIIDFCIYGKRKKMIKTISSSKIEAAKTKLKLCHSDLLDLKNTRAVFCIIIDDQTYPQVSDSLNSSRIMGMFEYLRIKTFYYYRDICNLKNFLKG